MPTSKKTLAKSEATLPDLPEGYFWRVDKAEVELDDWSSSKTQVNRVCLMQKPKATGRDKIRHNDFLVRHGSYSYWEEMELNEENIAMIAARVYERWQVEEEKISAEKKFLGDYPPKRLS